MTLYSCGNCKNLLFFENTVCLNCQHPVGFDPGSLSMISLVAGNEKEFSNVINTGETFRFCINAEYGTCNWLLPSAQGPGFCRACVLNRVIPTLTSEENLKRWKNIEVAKHRLVYSLLRLKLPIDPKKENEEEGIAFDFMADVSPEQRVVTGHDKGTITLNIEEADEAQLTRHKLDLGERYRTLLGHFRHEIGHYYWDLLIKQNPKLLAKFRKLFGSDELEYGQALENYYNNGAPVNWSDTFISPYASAHPWEDWAESWAHYLHLMDALETAYSFGTRFNPIVTEDAGNLKANITRSPYEITDFSRIIKLWLPLSLAMNSLNRSMGHADFYPFVISQAVAEKLRFVHDMCRKAVSY
jgi:hypothetical protein